jgi:hypothetical protein
MAENNKFDVLTILESLGDDIVKDMRNIIKINGAIATGRLYDKLKVEAINQNEKYSLVISYPFYGKFIDEGRKRGKMPPVDDIRAWTRLKGIPESAAFPIAKKIGEKGFKGINFTKPFYDDIKVIKEILTDGYSSYVVKVLTKDLK